MIQTLRALPDAPARVYALQDFRALLPEHGFDACKSVITRLEKRGDLILREMNESGLMKGRAAFPT